MQFRTPSTRPCRGCRSLSSTSFSALPTSTSWSSRSSRRLVVSLPPTRTSPVPLVFRVMCRQLFHPSCTDWRRGGEGKGRSLLPLYGRALAPCSRFHPSTPSLYSVTRSPSPFPLYPSHSVSLSLCVSICMYASLLHSAHLSSELVSDPPTHQRWLKLCHKTDFHPTW